MSRSKPLAPEASPHGGSSRPSQSKKTKGARARTSSSTTTDDDNNNNTITNAHHENDGDVQQQHQSQAEHTLPASPSMSWLRTPAPRFQVFVASLGNPQPYQNTLHSAGHIVLKSIASRDDYKPWRSLAGGQAADMTHKGFSFLQGALAPATGIPPPTLWQSGALMNVSGKAVKRAWAAWKKENGLDTNNSEVTPRLVIVHDELEAELGAVKVRTDPKLSARGHNGLKSVQAAFANEPFIRIGVGIGRPASRDPTAVSNYVLRPVTAAETQALQRASRVVMQQVQEIVEGAVG